MHSRMRKRRQRRARTEGKPEDGSIIYKICRSCGMCAKSDMDMRKKIDAVIEIVVRISRSRLDIAYETGNRIYIKKNVRQRAKTYQK